MLWPHHLMKRCDAPRKPAKSSLPTACTHPPFMLGGVMVYNMLAYGAAAVVWPKEEPLQRKDGPSKKRTSGDHTEGCGLLSGNFATVTNGRVDSTGRPPTSVIFNLSRRIVLSLSCDFLFHPPMSSCFCFTQRLCGVAEVERGGKRNSWLVPVAYF